MMARSPRPWTVLRHDPIEKLEDNLWAVEGDLPDMSLRRRMVIARLADGRLLIHNGVALREGAMHDIEAWGRPSILIVPNHFHRLDAHAYKARYPEIQVLCPAACDKAVRKVVSVDGHYEAMSQDPTVWLEPLEGSKIGEAVLIVQSHGRVSLSFCDTVFNQPHLPGMFGFIYRSLGQSGKPKVPFISKTLLVRDRGALRAHLERLAETPGLHRILVAHGTTIHEQPADALRAVAAEL